MKIYISGEIDATRVKDLGEKFQKAANIVEDKLNYILKDKFYGDAITSLFVCPIVMNLSKEMEKKGWFKERRLWKRKEKTTDFRLKIDYDLFRDSNDRDREHLILKNLIDSVRILQARAKKQFDGKSMEKDILEGFGITYENLCISKIPDKSF